MMETTVRYIPTQRVEVDGRVFQVGNKPALCFRGKEYALGVINDEEEIHSVRLSLEDLDGSPFVRYGSEPEYPVPKFISHLQRIMGEKPISTEAMKLIFSWPNNGEDFDSKPVANLPTPPRKVKAKKQSTCVSAIAVELKTTPQKIRKFLRSKGLHAPYENENQIRELVQEFGK